MNQAIELENTLPQFVAEMKKAIIEATDKYGDFTQYQMEDFFEHYHEEVEELNKEIDESLFIFDYKAIMKECVGVANMAWFIWWGAKRAKELLAQHEVP